MMKAIYIYSDNTITLKDNVEITIHDAKTHEVLDTMKMHNAVSTGLRNSFRDALLNGGGSFSPITHLAIGSGAPSDTSLGSEVFRDALTTRTTGARSLIMTYYLSSASANGYTLQEAALYTAISGGVYCAYTSHTPYNKTSLVYFNYTWTVTID